jgi:tetratricopeptide (TPR) repeat protein
MIPGIILRYAGNFSEASAENEKALRLHPYCALCCLFELAMSYRMAGRYEEALASCRQGLDRTQ